MVDPPRDWEIQEPTSRFLGVPASWLFRNETDAPEPDLWDLWLKARRSRKLGRVQKHVDALDASLRPARRIAKADDQSDRKDGRRGRA